MCSLCAKLPTRVDLISQIRGILPQSAWDRVSLFPPSSGSECLPDCLLLLPFVSCAILGQTPWLKESNCWGRDQIAIRVFAATN